MANAKLVPEVPASVIEQPDTFNWAFPNGDVAVVGKPQGVLRMKIYNILDADLRSDVEMVNMATAFLSIQTIAGRPPIMRTYGEFLALMERFGSDAKLDDFLKEYQKLINPELSKLIDDTINEGLKRKLKASELKEFMGERMMEFEAENRSKVKV
jgi:hypothetical protein